MGRNSKISWTSGLIFLLIVLNLLLMGYIWKTQNAPPGPMPGKMPPHKVGRVDDFLKKELKLSEDQFEQFKALRKAHIEENRRIHEEIRKGRTELIPLMAKDPEAARAMAETIGRLETKIHLSLVEHFQDLKAVCNPEQALKLEKVFRKALRPPGGRPGGPPPRR